MRTRFLISLSLFLSATLIAQTLNVTYNQKTISVDIAKMPHSEQKVMDHHTNKERTYSCVPLAPVLAAAGVPQKEALRGPLMSLILVANAKDNYRAVFALAELDEGTGSTVAFVCDAESGKPLVEADAPLKLLVTTDKRPARSVRMLTGITIVDAPK